MVVWHIAGKQSNVNGLGAFFVYIVLLGQSSSNMDKVRWLTGAWIMTSIVISHFYQGENIERLTAPLSPRMIGEFSELLESNITIYSAIGLKKTQMRRILSAYSKDDVNNVLGGYSGMTIFGKTFLRNEYKFAIDVAHKKLSQILYSPRNKKQAMKLLKVGFYISRLATCGSVAFVGPLKRVQLLKRQLQERGVARKRIAISKTPYSDVYDIWKFLNIPWDSSWFQKRIFSLFQSGIPLLWKRWEFRIST
ncbi:unnamed protein product [Orchesella dallaii]|uniref:Uncharacterized protein n=1 Tax=Orchesella dallaii TaxID=48710 RepID=A0ABP1Q024_9HEXA